MRRVPGALSRNKNRALLGQDGRLGVERAGTRFTSGMTEGQVLQMPIAHMDGCYVADEATLREMEDNGQIIFRFATPAGDVTDDANPNGSLGNITGVMNKAGNVLGMMPHPDRAYEKPLGSADGRLVLESFVGITG